LRLFRRCDDTEQTLDMTQALGMAPGLASLVMYIGSTDTAIISAMTTHSPLPTTIGCSWGWTPADPSTLDPYFEKMAAQGQNFFAASGDSSTWSSKNEAWPADDANVVSVGGTDLITASAAAPGVGNRLVRQRRRHLPGQHRDSLVAAALGRDQLQQQGFDDPSQRPGRIGKRQLHFYVCADQTTCTANEYGGTSFAAPMWAGYMALVNQQAVPTASSTRRSASSTLIYSSPTARL
jgi:subtilase family serine protease